MTAATPLSAPVTEPLSSSADALLPGAALPPPPQPWPQVTRVLFRIAFVYFALFALCYGNGSIFSMFYKPGEWIDTALTWPMQHLADFVSVHLLHNSGIGSVRHPTGSGDTLVDWVQQWLMLGIAIVGGLLWTAIAAARGHLRVEYTTAHAWLRFLLRLTTGMFLLSYGLDKLFPLQMSPLSSAILTEPVGNLSPMTMLWSLLALNPAYQVICGGAEVLGGVLILFRRTALAGALLGAFVMTNVLLYNLFFDVPVKLFAANLLLSLVFIILPDAPALVRFFWLHQPAAPTGVWVPPASRKRFRIATRVTELVFVVGLLLIMPYQAAKDWRSYTQRRATPVPMAGAWNIETPTASFSSPEQSPILSLYIDNATLVRTRSADGELWRTSLRLDDKAHTCRLAIYTTGTRGTYGWTMPDSNHLRLTAVLPKDAKPEDAKQFHPYTLTMTRLTLPSHYPLQDRGFHWVNEWGLER